ncbi:GNAT family N-acetyltransferase [Aurantiacibacter zhengii]|uniref:N-acetyltransferase n=1 Tax=Aurantiacibacter zhengii TaxID=2307003 RepID=A0A418NT57_9SPHN|nr:GNAT family N-acetyltransferase [Aurantiacibacter zhengii]RIV86603.1 N-acetyltransferase [Aurantiacibacter zhengii]
MRPVAPGEPPGQPALLTERLELWMPQVSDLQPMFRIICEETTARYLGGQPTLEDHFMRFTRNAGSWHLYGYGMFMVRERGGDGSLLGNCGIFHSLRGMGTDFDNRPEAGWIIRHDATGKGYAEEAMRAILDSFDERFARELMCLIVQGNVVSMKLADKLGFEALREAEMRDGSQVQLYRRPPARRAP